MSSFELNTNNSPGQGAILTTVKGVKDRPRIPALAAALCSRWHMGGEPLHTDDADSNSDNTSATVVTVATAEPFSLYRDRNVWGFVPSFLGSES